MLHAVVLASSLLAILLTLALAREVRLRRALQRLLARIFNHWRNAHESDPRRQSTDRRDGPAGDQ